MQRGANPLKGGVRLAFYRRQPGTGTACLSATSADLMNAVRTALQNEGRCRLADIPQPELGLSRAEVEEIVREELADVPVPTQPELGLSPEPALNSDGSVRHPGRGYPALGTIFEDFVRRLNPEAGSPGTERFHQLCIYTLRETA